ncbi:DUF2652 domain-containing protein [Flavihumibacter solisilvae]|uniref:DUF2652 domain-containing protein n=1 Tax=Flavihumibacter solisilvae TaxID=1349421 RepID=A0A0C1L718_9BACT|nr:DUF2652 domain-containing protein [Flavihumibacter solisilvae]KIC95952.1 hypothetical protein OI18_03470 [Flavihumibacter solisilvae]
MGKNGLLFIPDISGFSRFVNEADIEHSRLIIQELLEVLVNSNQIGLRLSEIEGDAILFYRYDDSPDAHQVIKQVEKMFCDFHTHLASYDLSKYCNCNACQSAVKLTLKIITHYGELTEYKVRNFSKLMGRDVIIAHNLMKNDIEDHEYWLATENMFPFIHVNSAKWPQWHSGNKLTDIGNISFQYTQLGMLRDEIKPVLVPKVKFSELALAFSMRKTFKTRIRLLFRATADFELRSRWMEGVKQAEKFNDLLPRSGMRCKITSEDGEAIISSRSKVLADDLIEFTENDEGLNYLVHYTLSKIEPGVVNLKFNYYIRKNAISELHFKQDEKEMVMKRYKKSFANLVRLIDEIDPLKK